MQENLNIDFTHSAEGFDLKAHIIYQDEEMLVLNKPQGLMVHPSPMARDVSIFATDLLKAYLGQSVSPVQRLDRKTSGVLIFGLNYEATRALRLQFEAGSVKKRYLAIVRGFFPEGEICVDRPLKNAERGIQEATTYFKAFARNALPIPTGRFPTSRYSLIEARPITGRMHQIRRHLKGINHPIIGDLKHGCLLQNRFMRKDWKMDKMLLHAYELEIKHPITKEVMLLQAPLPPIFVKMQEKLGLDYKF
jgi:tRNA pseudouridine65 synthase